MRRERSTTAATTVFLTILVTWFGALSVNSQAAKAGYYYVGSCSYYGNAASAFAPDSSAAHLSPSNECMVASGSAYRSLEINQEGASVSHGYGAEWSTTTPSPAIQIIWMYTPVNTVLVDCTLSGDGFTSEYFWGDGLQNYGTQPINFVNNCTSDGTGYADGINRYIGHSRWIGWRVGCWLQSSCSALNTSHGRLLAVNGVRPEAQEDSGPSLTPLASDNAWYHAGWIRGAWPIALSASDPSGVCYLGTSVDGQPVASWTDPSPDTSSWTQCHGSTLPATFDTTKYSDGHHSLSYSAMNSANVFTTWTHADGSNNAVLVDNAPVSLTLSGPTDAIVGSGVQHVIATATAGPSGVSGIACSADGSPSVWHPGSQATLSFQGLGQHRASCYAQNNSVDTTGAAATSAPRTWTLNIRRATALGIGFTRLVNALRCSRVHTRVKVPGRWVTVRKRHRLVRVFKRAHYKVVATTKCRPRTARRRIVVWVTVVRHGHKVRVRRLRVVRVILPPHVVSSASRKVAFGAGVTINGWLGTSDGTALSGAPVSVLAAPDNGQQSFAPVAKATTRGDGSWTARLPSGPSRLIEATYDGATTDEPSTSGAVRTAVPAKVVLRIHPKQARWGGKIAIRGRLLGGYVPPAGEVVVLRIGWAGGSTEIGHLYAGADGRFASTYTFLRGNGTETYRLWATTARENDYPFTPARSRAVAVTVHPG